MALLSMSRQILPKLRRSDSVIGFIHRRNVGPAASNLGSDYEPRVVHQEPIRPSIPPRIMYESGSSSESDDSGSSGRKSWESVASDPASPATSVTSILLRREPSRGHTFMIAGHLFPPSDFDPELYHDEERWRTRPPNGWSDFPPALPTIPDEEYPRPVPTSTSTSPYRDEPACFLPSRGGQTFDRRGHSLLLTTSSNPAVSPQNSIAATEASSVSARPVSSVRSPGNSFITQWRQKRHEWQDQKKLLHAQSPRGCLTRSERWSNAGRTVAKWLRLRPSRRSISGRKHSVYGPAYSSPNSSSEAIPHSHSVHPLYSSNVAASSSLWGMNEQNSRRGDPLRTRSLESFAEGMEVDSVLGECPILPKSEVGDNFAETASRALEDVSQRIRSSIVTEKAVATPDAS